MTNKKIGSIIYLSFKGKGNIYMIDLKKIVADIETYSDKHFNELSHFNNRVIDDALYLLLDEVMNENDVDYVKDFTELSYYISQCRFERTLTYNDFVELVSGASIGICGTYETYKHYLSPLEFEAYQNDTLDMSKMRGYNKGLCDIYLQAESICNAYMQLRHFVDIQELLNK